MSTSKLIGKQVLKVAEIARALGWRTETTRRWLRREGVLRRCRNGRYVTTPARLAAAFPEAVEAIRLERLSRADE